MNLAGKSRLILAQAATDMTANLRREIVIEIEKIRTIRKRAETCFLRCPGCGSETDFVTVGDAARLFEITESDIIGFISANGCHRVDQDGSIFICLPSMFGVIRQKLNVSEVKLLGE